MFRYEFEGEQGLVWGTFWSRSPTNGKPEPAAEVFLKDPSDASAPALSYFSLQKSYPQIASKLLALAKVWEEELSDAVALSFRFSESVLKVEEPVSMKRSALASFRIAHDLAVAGMVFKPKAIKLVDESQVGKLMLPHFTEVDLRRAMRKGHLLATGQESCLGAVSGYAAFNTGAAWELYRAGKSVILICQKLTYEFREALPVVGGALVCEGPILGFCQAGLPCIVSSKLVVKLDEAFLDDSPIAPGEALSIDGASGQVFKGQMVPASGSLSKEAIEVLSWCGAKEYQSLDVLLNSGNPFEIEEAVKFGAGGVGLCRIELFLFEPRCLELFQIALRAICTGKPYYSLGSGAEVLSEPGQAVSDFCLALEGALAQFFRSCLAFERGPVTVRLFDSSLAQVLRYWRDFWKLEPGYFIEPMSAWMHELNPMQGLRGGRLGLIYPELLKAQLVSLLRAWNSIACEKHELSLRLMMPGVSDASEVRLFKALVVEVAGKLGFEVPLVGSMLELPRACLTADEIARECDFLAFGTGDLSEATCGISRYDAALSFLPLYLEKGLFKADPFTSIDRSGVGELMKIAVAKVKAMASDFDIGMVGAQAVDPGSLAFCADLGLSYISVPLKSVPVARIGVAKISLAGS